MSEKSVVENVFNEVVENIADSISKKAAEEDTATSRRKKLFGRQKPLHHVLGGGKSADVLLWRNKKISGSVLMGATAFWVLFEWINFHLLTLVSFALMLGLLVQFLWSNASGFLSSTKVPRLVLPDDLFLKIGEMVGANINLVLGWLQDVACRGNLKEFLMVIGGLWALAIIGTWCNFLTVIYIGFVAAHSLPVLYEKYEDQIDDFAYKVLEQLRGHYQKLDKGVLSKIPKGKVRKKQE